MRARKDRSGRSNLSNTFFITLLVVGGFAAYLFIPKWWDFMEMKEIARAAGSRWNAADNEARARKEMAELMEHKEMPMYIPDDACTFSTKGDMRYIECSWAGDVTVPVINYVFPHQYEVTTEITPTGKISQW